MKKMLLVVALLAVGAAFGYVQSLGTAGDWIVGESRDALGEGTLDEAYVYARFRLTGIEFQVIDLGDASCSGDINTPGNDVWILSAVSSNDDMAQYAAADIPFVIENRGALALDLGMWNVTPLSITTGDDWSHEAWDADISYGLNMYKLMGVFAQGDWAPADEDAVKAQVGISLEHRINDALDWYENGVKFSPATEALDVFDGRANLNLPAACGTYSGEALLDYCQLRLRLAVGEGGTDQYSHAFQIALVSRITEGE